MRTASIILIGILLSGCVATSQSETISLKRTIPKTLTAEDRSVIETSVRRKLKDPYSAVFGTMVASQDSQNASWVCGSVNAKNSFGGYTGGKLYMGMLTHLKAESKTLRTFAVTGIGGTETENIAVTTMCNRYGVTQINR